MKCSQIRDDLLCHCFISKKAVTLGETCPFENKTVTELNMEANYKRGCGMTEKQEWIYGNWIIYFLGKWWEITEDDGDVE